MGGVTLPQASVPLWEGAGWSLPRGEVGAGSVPLCSQAGLVGPLLFLPSSSCSKEEECKLVSDDSWASTKSPEQGHVVLRPRHL